MPADLDVIMWMPQFVAVYLSAAEVLSVERGALVNIVEPPNKLIDSHTAHQFMVNRCTNAAARQMFKDTLRGIERLHKPEKTDLPLVTHVARLLSPLLIS